MHAQPEGLLLHQCLTHGHVDATLHLPDDQHRVDRSTDVIPDPYFGHADLTRLYVDVDPQHLRHDRGQDLVGPLADIESTAKQGHAAVSVELELDLRVRHIVPIDRGAGTAQVRTDGEAKATPARHRGSPFQEAGALDNLIDAVLQAAARDPQPVDGARVGLRQIAAANLDGIET